MSALDLSGGGIAITARHVAGQRFQEITESHDRFRHSSEAVRAARLLLDFLDPRVHAEVRVEGELSSGQHFEEARWHSVTRGQNVVWRRDE